MPEPKQLSVLKAKCLQRLERRSRRLGFCFEKCLKAFFWVNELSWWQNLTLRPSFVSWKPLFPSVSWQTQWDGLMSGLMFSSYKINPYTAMFLIIAQNSASRAFTTLILECGMCSDVSQRLICEEMLFLCVYAVKSSTQRNRRHRLQCSFISNKLILVGPLIARHDHKISYHFSVMFFFSFFF